MHNRQVQLENPFSNAPPNAGVGERSPLHIILLPYQVQYYHYYQTATILYSIRKM